MDDQYVTTLVEEQQIQILTGQDNYASWAHDILFVLQSRDAVDIVTGQEALPVQPDPDNKDKHVEEDIKDWMSRDKYARSVIGLSVSPLIRTSHLHPLTQTSSEMWMILREHYHSTSPLIFYRHLRRLHDFSWDTSLSVRENLDSYFGIVCDLNCLGRRMTDEFLAINIIMKLPRTPRWELVAIELIGQLPERADLDTSNAANATSAKKWSLGIVEKRLLDEDFRDRARYGVQAPNGQDSASRAQRKKGKGKGRSHC